MNLFHTEGNPELRGLHRTDDPETSKKAAASILPSRFTIRQQVEAFAKEHPDGFIDEQMEERWPHRAGSTLRTRRSELAQENIILDSGRTRRNAVNREMIVWVHRDFHQNPPPLIERQPQISKSDQIVRLEARIRGLRSAMETAIRHRQSRPVMCATASQMADILEAALAANN